MTKNLDLKHATSKLEKNPKIMILTQAITEIRENLTNRLGTEYTTLEIGPRDYKLAELLGGIYTAIEPRKDNKFKPPKNSRVHEIKLEDFYTRQEFDFIFARNSLPFVENNTKEISRLWDMLADGGYFFFTVFDKGTEIKHVHLNTKEEIVNILGEPLVYHHHKPEHRESTFRDGDKFFNIHYFVYKKTPQTN